MANRREFEIAFVGLKPGVHEFNFEIIDKFFEEYRCIVRKAEASHGTAEKHGRRGSQGVKPLLSSPHCVYAAG